MVIRRFLSLALGIAALGVGSANAAIQWTFDNSAPSPIPCASTGSNVGNSISCTPGTTINNLPATYNSADPNNVTAKAYSNTGTGGALAAAYVGVYSGGLGVSNAAEIAANGGSVNVASPDHAMDNGGTDAKYDSLLLSFGSKVALTGLTIGWWYNDSDMSIWAYTGTGSPTVTGSTYAAIAASADWKLVNNVAGVGTSSCLDKAGGTSVSSSTCINGATNFSDAANAKVSAQTWLVMAYNPMGGTSLYSTSDYVKLLSVYGVQPGGKVPEPSSALLAIAVFGAGGGVIARRRRTSRAR